MAAKKNIFSESKVVHNLLEGLPENSTVSLLGAKITNSSDLARIGEVYRSPRYETFHYLFTRETEVVGVTAVSCRLSNLTSTFTGKDPDVFNKDLLDRATKVNADTVYFLHNHPSGNPEPSLQDLVTTKNLIEMISLKSKLGFGGHVIINSTEYSLIHTDGTYETLPINYQSYNLNEMRRKNSFFGTKISGPKDLAGMAKSLEKSENSFLALGLSTKYECNSLFEVSYDLFEYSDKKVLAAIRNWSRASAVNRFALLNFSEEKALAYRQGDALKRMAESGIIVDIITSEGLSFRESLFFHPKIDFREKKQKKYEVNEYQTDYSSDLQLEFDFKNIEEEQDDKGKDGGKNQGNPPVLRHSGGDRVSGKPEHPLTAEPAGRKTVDERFGELFMWASRNRTGTAVQSTKTAAGNALAGETGSSDQRDLLPSSEPEGRASSTDSPSGTSDGTLQGNVRNLESDSKEEKESDEVEECALAHRIYEEIKPSIRQDKGLIDLREFHSLLNQQFDTFSSNPDRTLHLNAKNRVSGYAHGFSDEDFYYDEYGWVCVEHLDKEKIDFKPQKTGWASTNSISIRPYPNGFYAASHSIQFDNSGTASPVLLFNSLLYESRERAIVETADEMIFCFEQSDSKEAKFYLKEAKRIKAECGNFIGELFTQTEKEVESPIIKAERLPERNANNYIITEPDKLVPVGNVAKIKANILAIKTLKALESENRPASKDEQEILSHYVGWGGLKPLFKRWETPDKLKEYSQEIRDILDDEEWNSAAQSVLNAYYTPPEIIEGMWQAVKQFGFKGGHILEPSAGIGHFIGLMPPELSKKSHIHSVECDLLSARILAKLYPDAKNQQNYLEYASAKNNSMDLIISNVPFLENPHRDPRYQRMHLHDYFFNRGMDLLKPGGIMLAISSSGSLDSYRSRKSRQLLAEKADMIGAIRLPSNTFKKNAGAEVTSDIIVLRKKDGRRFQGHDFVRIQKMSGSEQSVGTKVNKRGEEEVLFKCIEINEYFVNNPHMMLGEMQLTKGRFADRLEQSLVANHENLALALGESLKQLPLNIINAEALEEDYEAVIANDEIKSYSFLIDEQDNVVQKIDGFLEKVDGFESKAMKKRAADFIELRESALSAVNAQVNEQLSDQEVDAYRSKLCDQFSSFVKKHGSPWCGAIQRQFRLDPEFALILSLQEKSQVIDNGEIKEVYHDTGLLKARTAWPFRLPEKADSIEDAFHISLAYKGAINLPYIAKLTGDSEAESQKKILAEELAFIDPKSGLLIDRANYLSGNVRQKLESAEAFLLGNEDLALNVKALKEVQPEPIGIDAINFRLGSQWIDEDVLNQWSKKCLSGNLKFKYSRVEHNWNVSGFCSNDPALSTERVSTKRLIEVTLALRNIEVIDRINVEGTDKYVLNEKETAYALEKQAALNENFIDFVKNNPLAYKKVEKDYNLTFNSFAAKEYAVPPIKYFPGASQIMEGRAYQKKAIVRAIHEPVLLAHAVGAGKTFEMITAVMEKKRLGIANKSMVVVQNATVAQFATFAKSLYPNARVLAPMSKSEYASKKRQLFLSRIASNDWDMVIIPQSFFNLIKDDPEFVKGYYQERIQEYKAAKEESSDKITVRNMEKAIERFQAAADSYTHEKGDDTLYFSQLGVDCLVLDEAHEFKKVGIATCMGVVKGLDTGVSQRAQRAYMKIRYIREQSNGRNVILATGTPITNTLAELYTMLRLTNEKTLEAYSIFEFDQFAAVFTEAVTTPELSATNKLKMVTRLAKFINQPELIRMFRTSADVITGSQLSNQKGVEKPQIIGGRPQAVVVLRGEWLGSYIESLQLELENFEAMSGKERREHSHIPLTVMSRARKAAIDPRLLGNVPGMGFAPDDPDSKTNTVIKEILRISVETEELNGTQMIFSDLYQAPDGSFNLFQNMKSKLIDAGIDSDKIAIIHDYKTDSQRERLFADMNAGRVRILFGTTERMGVGVNAQERMKAMHHMDAPWMPMQMEQRIGRIVRHGNIYAHNGGVYVQTYGVEKTMDAAIFQKILTKQKFIEAILEGKVNERVIEDESSDMALSAQEFTALFSGNPDVMRKFELESEIKTLKIQKDSWRQQMRTNRIRLENLTGKIASLEELMPLAKDKLLELQTYAKALEIDGRKLEINGELLADDKIKETLDNLAKVQLTKAAVLAVESDRDEFVMDIPDEVILNGRKLELKAVLSMNWTSGQVDSSQILYRCQNCAPLDISGKVSSGFGVMSSFKNAITNKPQEIFAELEEKYETGIREKASLEEFLSRPFRKEDELQRKENELATIVFDNNSEAVTEEPAKSIEKELDQQEAVKVKM